MDLRSGAACLCVCLYMSVCLCICLCVCSQFSDFKYVQPVCLIILCVVCEIGPRDPLPLLHGMQLQPLSESIAVA